MSGWISAADRLPPSGVPVIACYRNSAGQMRRIRAEYVATHARERSDDIDDIASEYDEETDIQAARVVPAWEPLIETMMFRAIEGEEKLPGRTVLLVDSSGSMAEALSRPAFVPKQRPPAIAPMTRFDAAAGLAMLLREICQQVAVVRFATDSSMVAPRRGFALRDALGRPVGGTMLGHAVQGINTLPVAQRPDRLIVITDEQTADRVPRPLAPLAYMVNIASELNGVTDGSDGWQRIEGWSEAIVRYIGWAERFDAQQQAA